MGQVLKMHNPVQNYAWGTRDTLARLRGAPCPAPEPEAELWVGAHPLSSSVVETPQGRVPLKDLVGEAPARGLAEAVGDFPYLLKILAIGAPLSLQVHPDVETAGRGYEREEAEGVPRDAPHRSYKDRRSKPETVVAVSPLRILTGIRPAAELREIAGALGLTWLAELAGYDAREIVTQIFAKPQESAELALQATVDAAVEHSLHHPFDEDAPGRPGEDPRDRLAAVADLILLLHDRHPGDRGIMVAVAMNQLFLAPGESAHTPDGQVHAYISGTAVEIMEASDNVMRAGLTPKHVDVPEMLAVLRSDQPAPEVWEPREEAPGVVRYQLWDPRLSLVRIDVEPERPVEWELAGIATALCTEGRVSAELDDAVHEIAGAEALLHLGSPDRARFSGSGRLYLAAYR
ncbi:mannose-6-phosphate isomerase, class I [Rothia halotolerans]|uniref:mannose-6-phosphate isomerase, class I n=1 Tax=Rothia halotolerans TaxID=405770 RepID=UPI00101E0BB4|nr:mannose-6-phosphate isomerase, class I [Rothia halotolerans]